MSLFGRHFSTNRASSEYSLSVQCARAAADIASAGRFPVSSGDVGRSIDRSGRQDSGGLVTGAAAAWPTLSQHCTLPPPWFLAVPRRHEKDINLSEGRRATSKRRRRQHTTCILHTSLTKEDVRITQSYDRPTATVHQWLTSLGRHDWRH